MSNLGIFSVRIGAAAMVSLAVALSPFASSAQDADDAASLLELIQKLPPIPDCAALSAAEDAALSEQQRKDRQVKCLLQHLKRKEALCNEPRFSQTE